MMADATISVVITTRDQARYLGEALVSVIGQSHAPCQTILVDDASRDDPLEVVRTYQGVEYIRTAGTGPSGARNAGLAAAHGKYICFLDADDKLHANALMAGLQAHATSPGSAYVYGGHRRVDRNGRATSPICYAPALPEPFAGLLRGNRIGMHGTVLYKREALASAGGFDETLRHCEDYDVLLRLAGRHPIASHPTLTADYRIHDRNASLDHRTMLKAALAVQAKHWRRQAATARLRQEGRTFFRDYYFDQAFACRPLRALALAPDLFGKLMAQRVLRRLVHLARRARFDMDRLRGIPAAPPVGRVRFGDLARTVPISRDFGQDRGRPIDRYYVDDFLARNADAIHGRVLEVGDSGYSGRFGGSRITRQDVLHVTGVPGATIVGDVAASSTLPGSAFDCIIFTQTLHLVFDLGAAVRHLHAALRPGGVLLVTVPGITPVDRGEWRHTWLWSLTPAALARLLVSEFPGEGVQIESFGNVYAATAFVQGMACEDVDVRRLQQQDDCYPVTVAGRARRT